MSAKLSKSQALSVQDGALPLTTAQYENIKRRAIELARENATLPFEDQRTIYELLILAGYPADEVRAADLTLYEDGVPRTLTARGFDASSAKLVVQEILHDPAARSDTRLKAAEMTLKATGALVPDPAALVQVNIQQNKIVFQDFSLTSDGEKK